MAIYGFCDIRNFTDTTEILQENVMIFVNEIAEIVHEITSQYCGCANKNIGDAFLLVWKFEDKFISSNNGELSLKNIPEVSQIIDMAVAAFIKIIIKIYKSHKLDKYRKDAGLRERIHNYQVKLGFGLHVGWSIEGAIGSTFKIDASYLSPNVNMASKLEEKTKDYGSNLILSEQIVAKMSNEARAFTRPIDRIQFNEGEDPITIYTIDIDYSPLKIEDVPIEFLKDDKEQRFEKIEKRIQRKEFYDEVINCKTKKVWDEIKNDKEVVLARSKFKKDFYDTYNKGYDCYIKGDWVQAKEHFSLIEGILGELDGASKHHMAFMRESNFKPINWHGFKFDSGH